MSTKSLLPESSQLWAWQSRLLPFVVSVLSLLTLFACVLNVLQVYQVEKHIENTHEVHINDLLPATLAGTPTASEQLVYARWRTLVAMEANAVESRYHQANMILMTRVYIVFLGFTTGMVLAMVGATFIVAKLRETEAKLEGGAANWKIALTTASPGLVLALFGTVLMLATIWARTEISVRDKSVYLDQSLDITGPSSAPVSPDEALKKLKESSESIKNTLENKEK